MADLERVYAMSIAKVYPLYVAKVERKGRTQEELDEVIRWLTGFDGAALRAQLDADASLRDFFDDADLNANASLITGVVCGVRVEDIEEPLMQKIRYLDKLVDELARGKPTRAVRPVRDVSACSAAGRLRPT